MTYEFRLPDIGEGVAEGEIVQWFVKEGDTIQEDAPLVSVLTDKANVEIPSPKSGRIVRIHAQVGEKVKVGGLMVTIDPAGAGGKASASASPTSAPAPPPTGPAKPVTAALAPSAPSGRPAPSPPPPVPAPATSASPGGRVLASPSLRRKAAELGIDLSAVHGSGPGGRILESDLASVHAPTASVASSPSGPAIVAQAPSGATARPTGPDQVTKVPIRGVRRVIFDHMAEAKHKAAHFTYVEEVDASELVRIRDRMAPHVEKQGVKLSYLPFIVKAVVAGLREQPGLNATMDDEHQELLLHSAFRIGIAIAAPDGLLVPVVNDADTKSIQQLAREIQSLAERGREGKLTREELTGSTFTITSLGALGGVLATPILNYPQVGILGVHKIVRRPVYRPDGSIGPADLMNLSVSVDHRVQDGIVAAKFLAMVKANLEDPHRLFADMA